MWRLAPRVTTNKTAGPLTPAWPLYPNLSKGGLVAPLAYGLNLAFTCRYAESVMMATLVGGVSRRGIPGRLLSLASFLLRFGVCDGCRIWSWAGWLFSWLLCLCVCDRRAGWLFSLFLRSRVRDGGRVRSRTGRLLFFRRSVSDRCRVRSRAGWLLSFGLGLGLSLGLSLGFGLVDCRWVWSGAGCLLGNRCTLFFGDSIGIGIGILRFCDGESVAWFGLGDSLLGRLRTLRGLRRCLGCLVRWPSTWACK